ncbi:hypothetical protein WV31_10965 [Magnetospirillum sp. ME-1]|uniref:hypothetical protein n=1 Tax=Magnetospirillum sp. ME-1 TaxID=1639348 RepID=UPI000A17BFBB|nr:hypothetical protein [Magnetospirillum sp. ME-1]ARJ66147.1 hypothetical protein WV31_10965 [Magnetospirillum sp. ME-1]
MTEKTPYPPKLNERDIALHKAIRMSSAEKVFALRAIRATAAYQQREKRMLRIHSRIVAGLDRFVRFCSDMSFRNGSDIILAGAWRSAIYDADHVERCSVRAFPSGERQKRLELAIAALGDVFGTKTRMITVLSTPKPGMLEDSSASIMWFSDDIARVEIRDRAEASKLLLEQAWNDAGMVGERLDEIWAALQAGEDPPFKDYGLA